MSRSHTLGLGSLLLPRHVADEASVSWPKCLRCMRNVDSYGIERGDFEPVSEGGSPRIEIWATCEGIRRDPVTGAAVPGSGRVHEPIKSGVVITKGPQWTAQSMTDVVRRLAFFAPAGEGSRDLRQEVGNADGVTVH